MPSPMVPPPPPEWAREAYRAASRHLDAGRQAEAEAGYRALLARSEAAPSDPADRWPEILGLTGLSVAWARRGRQFEALVLYRRIAAHFLAVGDVVRAAGVMGNRCLLLAQLQPIRDVEPALVELEGVLAHLPADEAAVARDANDILHAALATDHRRFAEARARLAAHDARPVGADSSAMLKRRTSLTLVALVHAHEGDLAMADAALEEAERLGPPGDGFALIAMHARLDVAKLSGDRARQREVGLAGLEAMRPHPEGDLDAGWRATLGGLVVAVLEASGADPALVREAQDRHASALIQRMVEIEDAVRMLPTLGVADLDADHELAVIRDHLVYTHEAALEHVARWFEAAPERLPRGLHDRMLPDGWAHVCAWCQRIRPADGTWLPLGQLLRRASTLQVTHTICPGCSVKAFRELATV
ncbi:MAG: hypothetical protein JNM10_11080 [Planctomycetia bacterium]|nr:hypothetical protein [Planctomycetia bacterium]